MTRLTIPGRLPGDKCPSCHKGWLIVVCITDSGSNGIRGPSGRSWYRRLIERVACTNCSTSYETSMHGQDVNQYILEQVGEAYDAKKRPKLKRCKAHPTVSLKEGVDGKDSALTSPRKYRFCQACLKVCWVGESEDEQKMRELAKDASPELRSAVKRLGKSMDKVGRRIRQIKNT